jgi:hypothetical protein
MRDLVFLLAQGLAEIVQRRLDLISERLGSVLGSVEDARACRIQQRRDTSPLSACSSSLSSLESNIGLASATSFGWNFMSGRGGAIDLRQTPGRRSFEAFQI